MGHNIGISASYYKPTEGNVFEDYVKAIDLLTINADTLVLRKQVTELTQKSKDNEHIIKAKLLEKEDEMTRIKEQMSLMQQQQKEIRNVIMKSSEVLNTIYPGAQYYISNQQHPKNNKILSNDLEVENTGSEQCSEKDCT